MGSLASPAGLLASLQNDADAGSSEVTLKVACTARLTLPFAAASLPMRVDDHKRTAMPFRRCRACCTLCSASRLARRRRRHRPPPTTSPASSPSLSPGEFDMGKPLPLQPLDPPNSGFLAEPAAALLRPPTAAQLCGQNLHRPGPPKSLCQRVRLPQAAAAARLGARATAHRCECVRVWWVTASSAEPPSAQAHNSAVAAAHLPALRCLLPCLLPSPCRCGRTSRAGSAGMRSRPVCWSPSAWGRPGSTQTTGGRPAAVSEPASTVGGASEPASERCIGSVPPPACR